jgi:Zn-dependent M16 (insulinase) family peptidase
MHIANDDPENLFCLSFQTLPNSSNGVAHILEHTVLCGSKKFPVKDPFFAMSRRSLNTFMNALTGQDFTCYPASSQVEKDFYNLLEVYLDAVFHPQLKRLSFLQEGHRLELTDPKNVNSPLKMQGVVYNEMKGAMNDADSRLWEAIGKHLLPDLPYGHNTGGNPKEIPSLSYEELVEFHQTFYQSSRCLFFFYGNLPLQKHLDFIEEHALNGVEKLPPLNPLPLQKRLTSPIRAVDYYPLQEGENPKGKAKIAFSWLTTSLFHARESLALCLIEIYLMETDASPLKQALLQSKLCQEVESTLDLEMSEIPLSIICSGCKEEDEERLKQCLLRTLGLVCKAPFDPKLVEASLHQLEFQRTEIGGEGGPFGLQLFMRAGLIAQHGSEPEQALLIHRLFHELRDQIEDPHFLPSLLRKHTIDNPHFLTQLLLPDPHLAQKEHAQETLHLKAIEAKLTPEEKQKLVEDSAALIHYQEESEKQSIECLPKVTLDDVPKKARDFLLQHKTFASFELYSHECFTNQIVYADLVFDLPHMEPEELPLLSLLCNLWTDLGCGGKSYVASLQEIQAYTGGIDAHLALHVSATDPNVLRPAFSLRGKALLRNCEPLFGLLYDYANSPNFTETARIQEWLLQHMSELEDEFPRSAQQYAIQLALSGLSTASYIYNQWNGIAYYEFVKKLSTIPVTAKTGWVKELPALAKRLVSGGKPHLIISAGMQAIEQIVAHEGYTLKSWKTRSDASKWRGDYKIPSVLSQARSIASPVAFTAMGLRTAAYRDGHVAELMISTQLLENVILHKEIREKGGAYGAGASYMPTTGNYHFTAYRDPNLSQTVATFHKAMEQISQGAFSERELEEAKLSVLAAMDTPVTPGGRAIVAYAWLRAGRTLADRQALREQILRTTKAEVSLAVKNHLLNLPTTLVSFLGANLYEKESQKIALPLNTVT